ncbi:26619_t:CDS:2, partial [Dentiscutata erythropus]
ISHAINQHIHLGFDISIEQDIENTIKDICGTSIANLKPNRDRGEFSGCILVYAIPNIGDWRIFTSVDLKKLRKKDIIKPNPEVSAHTISSSNWEVPIPNIA